MESYYPRTVGSPSLPSAFIGKRLHSLAGLFLVLFLIEHLVTNSQAALFVGDDGAGFINSVNFLYTLPYLPIIEITLLGFPILLHGWLGIKYLLTSKPNSIHTDGSKPALYYLPRNKAYTWQRITALIVVIGIPLHVAYMRFINHPTEVRHGVNSEFYVKVSKDAGLKSVSKRMDVVLVDQNTIDSEGLKNILPTKDTTLENDEVLTISKNFGTSLLLTVRDAFKSVWLCFFYTVFVLATCFHAFNGVWTFAISWGIALSEKGRGCVRIFSNVLIVFIALLGLCAIWGTYWINLRN